MAKFITQGLGGSVSDLELLGMGSAVSATVPDAPVLLLGMGVSSQSQILLLGFGVGVAPTPPDPTPRRGRAVGQYLKVDLKRLKQLRRLLGLENEEEPEEPKPTKTPEPAKPPRPLPTTYAVNDRLGKPSLPGAGLVVVAFTQATATVIVEESAARRRPGLDGDAKFTQRAFAALEQDRLLRPPSLGLDGEARVYRNDDAAALGLLAAMGEIDGDVAGLVAWSESDDALAAAGAAEE